MPLRFVRWFILNVLVFYLGLWLIAFIATRNIPASTGSATLVFSVLLPIAVFSFYKGKIRAAYPLLKTSHVSLCVLCNEKVERVRFTNRLWLIPYGFKSLRHYEARHREIARDARNARLSLTMFIDYVIVFLGALLGFGNTLNPSARSSLIDTVGAFLLPFVVIEALLWIGLHQLLVGRKGAIFGT